MNRKIRQKAISNLIAKTDIETQEDLRNALMEMGIDVTQATVSRDIKEMNLTKVQTDKKKYKYVSLENSDQPASRFVNLFKEAVTSIVSAENLVVVKTLTGSANGAASLIDSLNLSVVLGSIAGDDTILIVTKSIADAEELSDILHGYLR